MEGFHGTTESNLKAIIACKKIDIPEFKIGGDFVIPKGQRLPNDLGMGLYLFLSDDSLCFNGYMNAKRYAAKYKKVNAKVLKVRVKDDIKILDLNNPNNRKIFNQFREKLFDKVYYNYSSSIRDDGAKVRANLDGLFLEILIRYKFGTENIDGVICDSYTPFYNQYNQLSNIANGRELCLRDSSSILWDKCEEVN